MSWTISARAADRPAGVTPRRPGAPTRRALRPLVPLAMGLFAVLGAMPASAGLVRALVGQAPPDSGSIAVAGALDSVDVGAPPDRGLAMPADFLESLPGGRAARLDVEGPTRPMAITGPGHGRTAFDLDGFPVGGGVVRWEPDGWLPTRALRAFRVDEGRSVDGLATLVATTRPGPIRPASTVSMTGGDFGHRLSELEFGRIFGRTAFQVDVALFKHGGFAAFGPVEQSHGFVRLDFPAFGGQGLAVGQLGSGRSDYYESGAATGHEETDDGRVGLGWSRPARRGSWNARLLRETSRIRTVDSETDDLALERGRWWTRLERQLPGPGAAVTTLGLTASRDRRDGVRADGWTGLGAAITARHERSLRGGARLVLDLEAGDREPIGWRLDGGARLEQGDSLRAIWLAAGSRSVVPAILFHLDRVAPDPARTEEIVERLESLDRPETHRSFRLGARHSGAGGRLRLSIQAALLRSHDVLPLLSTAASAEPLAAAGGGRWSGELALTASWRPAPSIEFGLNGGGGLFRGADDPHRPRVTGDGWLRLRRVYFGGDLDLTGVALARLIGERHVPGGGAYPTVMTGRLEVAARIRTLTLFWRMENPLDQYVESDLVDADGLPFALPGRHYRIGATLRLLD